MIVGKVVGSIVSTRKSEKLIGNKFMIVEPVHHMKAEHSQIVAIDIIGAGIGEYVLVAQGSAARIGCGVETAPVDAAIGYQRITENYAGEWCCRSRWSRFPYIHETDRQSGYHSYELCRVRTITETSQTVVGEARIRDHENIRYGCGDGRSFTGHYRNQKVLCTDDQCFKSAY